MKPGLVKQRVRWAHDTPELGGVVRRIRRDQGLTQAELAERMGVTRMTVSRLEHGDAVSTETALRALSECGYAVVVAPKFARLGIEDNPPAPSPRSGPGR